MGFAPVRVAVAGCGRGSSSTTPARRPRTAPRRPSRRPRSAPTSPPRRLTLQSAPVTAHGLPRLPRRTTSRSRATPPARPSVRSFATRLDELRREQMELPLVIGGKDIQLPDTFEQVMPHDKATSSPPSRRAARSTSGRRSTRPQTRGTTGRGRRGKSVPRCCFALPSCSPDRGARRSTRRRCSASRRPPTRRRSTPPAS